MLLLTTKIHIKFERQGEINIANEFVKFSLNFEMIT